MENTAEEGKTVAVYLHQDVADIIEDLQSINGIGSFSGALRFIVRDWHKTREANAKKLKSAVRRASKTAPDSVTVSLTTKASEIN